MEAARRIALPLLAGLALAGPALAQAPPAEIPPATRGPAQAPLEIVEFSDFQCPFCGQARPVVDSLLAAHADEVRIVYRNFPLPMHEHAQRAAEAAVEAARQEAFWPYHDLLFAHQDALADVDLIGYARQLGLDADAFRAALEQGTHRDEVQRDVDLGLALAVHGTPTFFVNGYRLVGVPPLWALEVALEAFREGRVERRPLEPPRPPG